MHRPTHPAAGFGPLVFTLAAVALAGLVAWGAAIEIAAAFEAGVMQGLAR